jgi:hypothetical protein
MDHRTFRELAAGAALGDLDPAERASLDAHLAGCPACRDDARTLVDTAGLLAYGVPQRRAPSSLRDGVLAAIAAADSRPGNAPAAALALAGGASIQGPAILPVPPEPAPADRAAPGGADRLLDVDSLRRERTRYRLLSVAGLAAAAVLAVAVGALGTTAAGLDASLQRTTAERDAAVARLAQADQAMAVVLAPDHATATLTTAPMAAQASVYVVYRPGTDEAWLMAANLPVPPPGKVYQLWSADSAGVHGLATFTCDATGGCLAPFGVDLGSATATMITLEPVGGAVGDPGPQVAFGELDG